MTTTTGPETGSTATSTDVQPGDMQSGHIRPTEAPAGPVQDRRGAALAFGFVALLLGTEGALTLPDENASAASVATFYADHRLFVVALQLLGLVAAGLLAGYAWRLRGPLGRGVAATGVLAAVLACVPGAGAIGLALAADPSTPATSGRWNDWLPFTDDVLFLGFALFTAGLAVRLGRRYPVVTGLAAMTTMLLQTRLALELFGHPRGAFESLGPVSLVVLVATLGVLSARGRLTAARSDGAPSSTA